MVAPRGRVETHMNLCDVRQKEDDLARAVHEAFRKSATRWTAGYDDLKSTIPELPPEMPETLEETDGKQRRAVYNTLGVTVWAAKAKERTR